MVIGYSGTHSHCVSVPKKIWQIDPIPIWALSGVHATHQKDVLLSCSRNLKRNLCCFPLPRKQKIKERILYLSVKTHASVGRGFSIFQSHIVTEPAFTKHQLLIRPEIWLTSKVVQPGYIACPKNLCVACNTWSLLSMLSFCISSLPLLIFPLPFVHKSEGQGNKSLYRSRYIGWMKYNKLAMHLNGKILQKTTLESAEKWW